MVCILDQIKLLTKVRYFENESRFLQTIKPFISIPGIGSKVDYEHIEYATRPHARRYGRHAFRGKCLYKYYKIFFQEIIPCQILSFNMILYNM